MDRPGQNSEKPTESFLESVQRICSFQPGFYFSEAEKSSTLFCQRTRDKDICLWRFTEYSSQLIFQTTHISYSHKMFLSTSNSLSLFSLPLSPLSPPISPLSPLSPPKLPSLSFSFYSRVKLFMQILFISVMFCHIETSKTFIHLLNNFANWSSDNRAKRSVIETLIWLDNRKQ